jgi:hypothetical protein
MHTTIIVYICVNKLSKIENCANPSEYNNDCMHVYVIQYIYTCICIYASHNTECLLLSTLNTFNYDDDMMMMDSDGVDNNDDDDNYGHHHHNDDNNDDIIVQISWY